ncbi:acyltransferase [Enterobacter pseudoroggenkampii]|uniref:acyltransferase n=2 Tax=Enterobacter pseudoroggenkampii TaxID=2996112 RepID=UPI0020064B18|nr:acyltransferase [Enterobacter roggenkampii]
MIKAYHAIINIVYLFLLKILTKNSIVFKFPKIGAGFNVMALGNSTLDLNNLSARNYLNIIVNKGLLVFEKNCFVNNGCSFNCLESIYIGENTLFGEGVKIYDHDHIINEDYQTCKNAFVTSPVIIGKNCWIGSNTVILKGVNIADNVVIGANSLVNKSISVPGIYVYKNGSLNKIK